MNQEYVTIKDEAEIKAENKKIKIIGSLSEVMHNLLNEIYHNPGETIRKKTMTTFESLDPDFIDVPGNDIVDTIVGNINDNYRDTVILATTTDQIDQHFIDKAKEQLETINDVHLVTASKPETDTLTLQKEQDVLMSLENLVLENHGRVYRVILA